MSRTAQDDEVDVSPRPLKRRRVEHEPEPADVYSGVGTGNSMPRLRSLDRCDYTVGWITALPLEMAAAKAMVRIAPRNCGDTAEFMKLDEDHQDLLCQPNDTNAYTLGSISGHNVVIACLPVGVYGTTSAATVASQMRSSFPSIRIPLMVGIGGGAPTAAADIRLGDVVVSIPTARCPAVVQYDCGKTVREGQFQRTGALDKPLPLLLTHVSKLRSNHESKGSRMAETLSETFERHPLMAIKYGYQGRENDVIFRADYEHVDSEGDCHSCDRRELLVRSDRDDDSPMVHYGPIASANQVMKHAGTRDRLANELGIVCFEMEAAGLMDSFSCLVIRGICDYADSHKHKVWQLYAAITAAAYAKEILSIIPTQEPMRTSIQLDVDSKASVERRKLMMDTLHFDLVDVRRATIKDAHQNTCKWLLQQSKYREWHDWNRMSETHGFLWIKGKPGTGKSTIMKFVLGHAEKTISTETVVISFFFNARGEELEKSIVGMYRSFFWQLL